MYAKRNYSTNWISFGSSPSECLIIPLKIKVKTDIKMKMEIDMKRMIDIDMMFIPILSNHLGPEAFLGAGR